MRVHTLLALGGVGDMALYILHHIPRIVRMQSLSFRFPLSGGTIV